MSETDDSIIPLERVLSQYVRLTEVSTENCFNINFKEVSVTRTPCKLSSLLSHTSMNVALGFDMIGLWYRLKDCIHDRPIRMSK